MIINEIVKRNNKKPVAALGNNNKRLTQSEVKGAPRDMAFLTPFKSESLANCNNCLPKSTTVVGTLNVLNDLLFIISPSVRWNF